MKQRKAVSKKKATTLRASADERKRSKEKTPEWAELFKPIKKPITLRVDADVLAWFKKQGRGYQTRINRALRKAMEE
ncbi:MAG: BrnA antitoxin family protein [Acidobacteria bacterium]|nr:BrnA antitoxin family protein [Acidobacteriota bacterium]